MYAYWTKIYSRLVRLCLATQFAKWMYLWKEWTKILVDIQSVHFRSTSGQLLVHFWPTSSPLYTMAISVNLKSHQMERVVVTGQSPESTIILIEIKKTILSCAKVKYIGLSGLLTILTGHLCSTIFGHWNQLHVAQRC